MKFTSENKKGWRFRTRYVKKTSRFSKDWRWERKELISYLSNLIVLSRRLSYVAHISSYCKKTSYKCVFDSFVSGFVALMLFIVPCFTLPRLKNLWYFYTRNNLKNLKVHLHSQPQLICSIWVLTSQIFHHHPIRGQIWLLKSNLRDILVIYENNLPVEQGFLQLTELKY